VPPRSLPTGALSTAQAAVSWLLHKPAVTAALVGASKLKPPGRARGRQLPPSDEEIARLEKPYVPHPMPGIEL